MVRRPKQNCFGLQRHAGLAIAEHLLYDIARLVGFITRTVTS